MDNSKSDCKVPQIWWSAEKDVGSTDDFINELPHRAPDAVASVKIVYLIGAHLFQEHSLFLKLFPNLEEIYIFEPMPRVLKVLEQLTAHLDYVKLFPYALADFDGAARFHVTNNLESSSLLDLEKHKEVYPQIHEIETITVACKRLDTVIREHGLAPPDLLFIDVQGAEYKLISSIPDELLADVKLLYTEVSTIELYKGAKNLPDIQACLSNRFYYLGFAPQGNDVRSHGNALFINKKIAYTIVEDSSVKFSAFQYGIPASLEPAKDEYGCLDYTFDSARVREFWDRKVAEIDSYIESCEVVDANYSEKDYIISALVTTYKSEKFIEECLEDLENQVTASQTEIIFIDACSPENERGIVSRYQDKFRNIRYIRTPRRISVYAAWNLAARMSRGHYLTTFSTNDRLRQDGHKLMADALDENPSVKLVYGDSHVTNNPHESFEKFTRPTSGLIEYKWPAYSYNDLLNECQVGPHPMWRREVHQDVGYWDERYEAVGDQDFFLRIGEKYPLLHIDEYTGLYWSTPDSVCAHGFGPKLEVILIRMRHYRRNRIRTGMSPQYIRQPEKAGQCGMLLEQGKDALRYRNIVRALDCFSQILSIDASSPEATALLGELYMFSPKKNAALWCLLLASAQDPFNLGNLKLLAFFSHRNGFADLALPILKESMRIHKNPDILPFIRKLEEVVGIRG